MCSISAQQVMWMCACLRVWISAPVWSPLLHSGNYFYQGLDEGEGKEERERWKETREKGGSRFRERTEKGEKQREEKRDWGLHCSECFATLSGRQCTLSKHELEDNSWNLEKITGSAKHSYFQGSTDQKALWIVDYHHKVDVATMHLQLLQERKHWGELHVFLPFP